MEALLLVDAPSGRSVSDWRSKSDTAADVSAIRLTRSAGLVKWMTSSPRRGFANGQQARRQAHFVYEADRGTMNTTDMLRKLRAYYHLIKKQQRHREAFGIHPIRALLVETTNESRARRLMELVHHPLLCGREKRAGFGLRSQHSSPTSRKVLHLIGALPSILPLLKCCLDPSGLCLTAVCTGWKTPKTRSASSGRSFAPVLRAGRSLTISGTNSVSFR